MDLSKIILMSLDDRGNLLVFLIFEFLNKENTNEEIILENNFECVDVKRLVVHNQDPIFVGLILNDVIRTSKP